jgi:stage II sporulation protein AA (anti-sigma F factor antagonist)
MKINCNLRNNNLVCKLSGDIDHHNATLVRSVVSAEFSRHGAKNLVFDFSHVGFMDSSGVGLIIGRYKEVSAFGGKVFAINISPELNRIFEISGLKKIIQCYESLEQAELDA